MLQYQSKKDKKKFNKMFYTKQTKNLTNFINKYYLTYDQNRKLITSDWVIWEERHIKNDAPTKVTTYLKIYGKYYVIHSKQWVNDSGYHIMFIDRMLEVSKKELV